MCTVTFIPEGEHVFLTSNRDEKHFRSDALYPTIYPLSSGNILFPKDRDAGGTWAAMHENGSAIIFLNGGIVNHKPEPPYRKSRGLILLDLINSASPYQHFLDIDLQRIEPFTAVIYEQEMLWECRWDGNNKYVTEKDPKIPHIWSSVTLYEPEIIQRREQWFSNWLNQHRNKQPDIDHILHFHQFTGDGDSHNDLLMNRNGQVFTVSITSIEIKNRSGFMHYLDLKNNKQHKQVLEFNKTAPVV